MTELIEAALHLINIPFTVLLALVLLYWVTVIVGLLDVDSLDVDVDADLDADLDLDHDIEVAPELELDTDLDADLHVDADTAVEVSGAEVISGSADAAGGALEGGGDHGGFLNSVLLFANLGYVPFMIIFSFLMLFMWSGAVLLNHYYNPGMTVATAALLFVPNFIVSFFAMKLFTWPLKKVFYQMRREERAVESVVGQVCVLTMDASPERLSQATVARSGVPHLLNVRPAGDSIILRGSRAVVVSYNEKDGVYLVQALD